MGGYNNNYRGGFSRGNYNNNRNDNYRNNNNSYVGAPYNFVSQWNEVIPVKKEELIPHDSMNNEQFSGEIIYEIDALNDLIIDDGTDRHGFYKNAYGEYAIPGSSIRGLIRSNVQILGLSSLKDDIDDYNLMFRCVGGSKDDPNKQIYSDILGSKVVRKGDSSFSVLKNVKAGYLKKENGKYRIYRTKVESIDHSLGKMNYYSVSERFIKKDMDAGYKKFPFFKNHPECLQHILEDGFRQETDRRGRIHYKGSKNKEYKPYYKSIYYELAGDKNVTYIGDNKSSGSMSGYVLGTGYMNEKKVHYVIPEIDMTKPSLELKESDIRAYNIDYNYKEKQLGKEKKDYYKLPENNECRPVFYIELNGRIYFGYTPRLRLFYKYTISDGLSGKHKNTKYDLAKSMFGFSNKDVSYKSKVLFSDAELISEAHELGEQKLVLGGPKASSYNDYLETDKKTGNATTYNDNEFRLRGVKQYWLRDQIHPASDAPKKDSVASRFSPLSKGTKFMARIRFKNLTKEEYGLLLWSIALKPGSQLQIGKAKSTGYGRIKICIKEIRIFDPDKAYKADSLNLNPFEEYTEEELKKHIDEMITVYKKYASSCINTDIESMLHIKEFFAMKDISIAPPADRIRFMKIDDREYQNRKPLKDVAGTIGRSL